jgi:hypothetical protein
MATDPPDEEAWLEDETPTADDVAFEKALERASEAIREGDADGLVRVFVEEPVLAGNLFWTAPLLGLAAEAGGAGAIAVLLEAGVPPGTINESGGTPLMAAAWSNHLEAARLLLDAGADPNILVEDHCHGGDPDVVGRSALFFALAKGHQDLVNLLEPVTRPDVRDLAYRELPAYLEWEENNPPPHVPTVHLFMAIQSGQPDRLREAIVADGNVNHLLPPEACPPLMGGSPLSWAAATGRMDLVAPLLEAGADPDLPCHLGLKPADFAALNGHPEIVRSLRAEHRNGGSSDV